MEAPSRGCRKARLRHTYLVSLTDFVRVRVGLHPIPRVFVVRENNVEIGTPRDTGYRGEKWNNARGAAPDKTNNVRSSRAKCGIEA